MTGTTTPTIILALSARPKRSSAPPLAEEDVVLEVEDDKDEVDAHERLEDGRLVVDGVDRPMPRARWCQQRAAARAETVTIKSGKRARSNSLPPVLGESTLEELEEIVTVGPVVAVAVTVTTPSTAGS